MVVRTGVGPSIGPVSVRAACAPRQAALQGVELGAHLAHAAAVFKQAPAYENQHIPGGVAPMGHPATQGRVFKNTAAVFAVRGSGGR